MQDDEETVYNRGYITKQIANEKKKLSQKKVTKNSEINSRRRSQTKFIAKVVSLKPVRRSSNVTAADLGMPMSALRHAVIEAKKKKWMDAGGREEDFDGEYSASSEGSPKGYDTGNVRNSQDEGIRGRDRPRSSSIESSGRLNILEERVKKMELQESERSRYSASAMDQSAAGLSSGIGMHQPYSPYNSHSYPVSAQKSGQLTPSVQADVLPYDTDKGGDRDKGRDRGRDLGPTLEPEPSTKGMIARCESMHRLIILSFSVLFCSALINFTIYLLDTLPLTAS